MVLIWTSAACSAQNETDPWPDLPVSLNRKLPNASHTSLWEQGRERRLWHQCIPITQPLLDNWDARKFFDDPQVVELCEAIFAGDIERMEQLIDEGVDVNAKGECGMNPLYWAFHLHTDPRPFGCLIKHGADPNIIVNMMGRREEQVVFPGYSVTHLSMRRLYNRHFKTVFENGGDPNLINECPLKLRQSPAFFELSSLAPDCEERIKLLVEKGANFDLPSGFGFSFLMASCLADDRRCEIGLYVVESGFVDPHLTLQAKSGRHEGLYLRAIHHLAMTQQVIDKKEGLADELPHYFKLVAKLEELGESLEDAKEDLARWKKWKEEGRMDLIEEEYQKSIKSSRNDDFESLELDKSKAE